MRPTVIISTYNSPAWLEKVLWGYSIQSHRDFEMVIADDGSTNDTAELIESMRKTTGMNLNHVWHDDRGFRKCTILNRAIVTAQTDYLIFSDGDCIPRDDFVQTHVRLARPGYFLSGGLVRLPLELSESLTKNDILGGDATNAAWLRKHGMPWDKKLRMLGKNPILARAMDWLTTTRATWNGHNASAAKSDILRVNGYDERMEHGGLDRELGERLVNAGVRPIQIRYRAPCVHLDHGRGYCRPEALALNRQIRRRVRDEHLDYTPFGIDKAA
ncbi:MAG: glycosyltransferase family 2 protein [Pirellulales bacterium]|nr:glycosyltransferase family 2 protein [Pirellulales bacterium]